MFQLNLIRFVKMFSYVFLYKSLQGLAQVNRTWLSLIVGYEHHLVIYKLCLFMWIIKLDIV